MVVPFQKSLPKLINSNHWMELTTNLGPRSYYSASNNQKSIMSSPHITLVILMPLRLKPRDPSPLLLLQKRQLFHLMKLSKRN